MLLGIKQFLGCVTILAVITMNQELLFIPEKILIASDYKNFVVVFEYPVSGWILR